MNWLKQLLTLLLALILSLSSCAHSTVQGGLPDGGSDTTASETTSEGGETTTAPETTTEADTAPETDPPTDNETPMQALLLSSAKLGLTVKIASSDNERVVSAEMAGGDLLLTSYNPGSATVTAMNSYGESVRVSVTVARDYSFAETVYTPFVPPENAVLATDFGMSPGKSDNAPYLQAAIDALLEGGTVYVPAGRYAITYVELKSNITLRLEGILPEYNVAFEKIASKVQRVSDFAIIETVTRDMFGNHAAGGYGREGADNITISGGVFDMKGKSRCFIWCCGDNITLENTVLRDCPNNHAIQITGCTNVTLRNVSFAGYNVKDNVTSAEVVQIESSHSGAIGETSAAGSKFDDYEYIACKNVTIENCYFGKSDVYEAPTFPIGHHGQNSGASVTGLRILGCTFDNPRVVAIRAYAYTDVEIADCLFLSDRNNTCSNTPCYMIELTLGKKAVKLPSGAYLSTESTFGGCNNYRIHGNRFVIGEESAFAGIIMNQNTGITSYDVKAEVGIRLTDYYKDPPRDFTGYQIVSCHLSDIAIFDNDITVENTAGSCLYFLNGVLGLSIENNALHTDREYVVSELGDREIVGARLQNCISATYRSKNVAIQANAENQTAPIVLKDGDASVLLFCTGGNKGISTLRIRVDGGGRIDYTASEDGALTVTAIPEDGYRFDGYYAEGNRLSEGRATFGYDTTVTARFVKTEP